MKKNLLFSLLAGLLILGSCTPGRMLTSSVPSIEVVDLQRFETLSYTGLISKGNRVEQNDSVTQLSRKLFKEALTIFTFLPITDSIEISCNTLFRQMELEISGLFQAVIQQRTLQNITLTPVLDSLLEAGGKRFGLITVTTGFTRIEGNLASQTAKGLGIGLLTLGMFIPVPIASQSTVYAMIVDARENNIAFFRSSTKEGQNPLDKLVLAEQIQEIFNGYYWDL